MVDNVVVLLVQDVDKARSGRVLRVWHMRLFLGFACGYVAVVFPLHRSAFGGDLVSVHGTDGVFDLVDRAEGARILLTQLLFQEQRHNVVPSRGRYPFFCDRERKECAR